MLHRMLLCTLIMLLPVAHSADWPTGSYQLNTQDITLEVTIRQVMDNQLLAQVSWPSSQTMNLQAGSVNAPFDFQAANVARLTLVEAPLEYFQIKLTTFGELVFSYYSDARPELNTTGFLKVNTEVLLNFADYSQQQAKSDLPDKSVWQDYITNDLWPFWSSESAQHFPSYRCDDGRLPERDDLCPELNAPWLRDGLEYDYTRMVSRQTYAYGVMFHLTGEPQALALMQQGVDILLSRLQEDGSVATVLQDGEPIWQSGQHTSQDLAYAQVGLAMAYSLTGDDRVLQAIERIKTHIFSRYRNPDWNMLAWTVVDQQPDDSQSQELVAQLDQLNAYLLLVYPLLDEDQQARWAEDIRWLVNVLIDSFYLPEQQRFAGVLKHGSPNAPGERHNDYGHSVKAFWMILLAGELLGQEEWTALAEQGIRSITGSAFRYKTRNDDVSQWANQSYSSGSSWWEFAELTQASATIALRAPEFIRYLPESYDSWQKQYVDKNIGGVWMGAGGGAKQHLWKNGYHETELALVAYITTALINDEPFSLFYAKDSGVFKPYFFEAPTSRTIPIGLDRTRVIFNAERPQ